MMNWWNLGLFGILTAGHTEIWVAVINRLHAVPLPRPLLVSLRCFICLIIVAAPLGALYWLSGSPSEMSLSRQWDQLGMGERAVVVLSGIGFVSLLAGIVRYQLREDPTALRAVAIEVVDVAKELGGRPISRGPLQWLAKLPGNEQFQVELIEKRIALPRLPVEWEGLRILQLTDWHLLPTIDRSFIDAVLDRALARPADLVLFTGDLVDDLDCLSWLPDTLGRCDARLGRYFILGNHDWALDADVVRTAMVDAGWCDLGGRLFTIEFEGHRLCLAGDETPWIGRAPDFSRALSDDFRVLLSHTPDHFARARANDVDLMLSGHNHGGQVVLPVVGPVFAPSRYGVKYASGVFSKAPTVMHVARGLAGCHPLRWRCRPEVTWLVLERETA